MFSLIHFIESNNEYQKSMDFSDKGEIADITNYLIFNEDVHIKDGRVFRVHNKILVAVNFNSAKLTLNEIIEGMVEFDLDPSLMVDYRDLPSYLYRPDTDKVRQIILEMKLIEFLNERDFRFKDGSILSMSKLSNRIVEGKKRLEICLFCRPFVNSFFYFLDSYNLLFFSLARITSLYHELNLIVKNRRILGNKSLNFK